MTLSPEEMELDLSPDHSNVLALHNQLQVWVTTSGEGWTRRVESTSIYPHFWRPEKKLRGLGWGRSTAA